MITVEYFNGLPTEYEFFLTEKYDSFFTTCKYIEINYSFYEIGYILVKQNNILKDLLIFGNKGNLSLCLNSLVSIEPEVITVCTNKIFQVFHNIKKIKISASYNTYKFRKSFIFSQSKNYILKLPSTIEEYYLQLGQSTRKNTKNQTSKLHRDYPTMIFKTLYDEEISLIIIDRIMQLNTDRMTKKGIIVGKDKLDVRKTHSFSKYYGCVTCIEIDGKIIAGNISYIINKNIYVHVISHDNNFSNYSLGRICILNTIEIAISKKLENLHFLWGENEYKTRLMAKPQQLFSYYIFRNYSIGYFFNLLNALLYRLFVGIRISKHTLFLRNAIKSYRKKYWHHK